MARPERTYIRKRKLTGKVKAARTIDQVISDWTTLRIRTALGVTFRETSRIRLVRPIWMPMRLYSWLMRSVVVDRDSSLESPPSPRSTRSGMRSTDPLTVMSEDSR